MVGPPLDTPEATAALKPAAGHTKDVAAGDWGLEKLLDAAAPVTAGPHGVVQ